MKYYAMIDGRQSGPYELEELAEAGVGPSTYVWCKGMPDWQPADEVADICRFWRKRLAELMHPETPTLPNPVKKEEEADEPPIAGFTRRGFPPGNKDSVANPDPEIYNNEPPFPLIWAVLVTILCMPVTGIAAVYYSVKASREWTASHMEKGEDADKLRRSAWDHSRRAKMLTGISLFLGMIIWAFLFRFGF